MYTRARRFGLIFLSMVLISCTTDKEISLSNPINIPNTWADKDHHLIKTAKNEVCFAWWHQYHDTVLNQLIEEGLRYNNDIRIAMANVEAAEGELKRVEFNWIPTVAGNIGYSSFPYLGYPGVLLTAVPNYTLNIFSQIKQQARAKSQLKATKAMRNGVKLAVIAQIARSYFAHLAQVEKLQLLETVEDDLTKSLAIYKETTRNGLTTGIEVAKAKSELDLIKSEETLIKKNIVLTQNALRYLMNQNPGSLPLEFKQSFSKIDSNHMVVGALPLKVIEHRPDMIAAINEFKATRADIGVVLSNFLPSINLSMARGDIATIPNGSSLGTSIHFNQAILSQPLITFTSLGELARARGVSKAAYHHYVDTLRRALRDVDNDMAAHEYYTKRLDDTVTAKNEEGHAYQLNRNLYHQGLISYLSLLNEKVKLDELNVLVNKRKIEQTLTIINLYQDLAVGYGYHPK